MNKVAKNAAWIIGVKVAQSLMGLVISMISARYLGPSNYGLITYASSLVTFAVPIMQLGMNNVLVQSLINAPENEGEILGTSILLNLISSVCCIAGVTTFVLIAHQNETETIIVCLLYSLMLLVQALDQIQYWYQAKLLSKYTSVISMVIYVVIMAYKIYILATAKSVYWFAVTNTLDYALIAIASIALYYRLGGQKLTFSLQTGKKLFAKSKHYIISSLMIMIFAQTDKIMIRIMIDESATGYYGAAMNCAQLTTFIFAAIIDSFRPSILEGQRESEKIFEHRLMMLYSIVIYLSLAQSIFMTLFAKWIISFLYGETYAPAINALRIVVWYTTFSYYGGAMSVWILAKEKQKYLLRINLSGALANVILNAFLIPTIGINGAALASLITQFLTNVVVCYIIKPIRSNTTIVLEALKPKYFFDAMSKLRQRSEN